MKYKIQLASLEQPSRQTPGCLSLGTAAASTGALAAPRGVGILASGHLARPSFPPFISVDTASWSPKRNLSHLFRGIKNVYAHTAFSLQSPLLWCHCVLWIVTRKKKFKALRHKAYTHFSWRKSGLGYKTRDICFLTLEWIKQICP